MSGKYPHPNDGPEPWAGGLYDPEPGNEADLWFLPDMGEEAEDAAALPLPRAERGVLFDPREWLAAQDALSGPLAELACLFGALDERLRAGPDGWRRRLALLEVADLGWWTGERFGADRLALWVGLRLGATGDDAQALARAGWAVRRLSGGPGPSDGGWEQGLAGFLDRATPDGMELPDSVADLAEVMGRAGDLHPVTQTAMLFHARRMPGPDGPTGADPEAARDIEAAVLAARHGAAMGRGGALFMPLSLSGPQALRAAGPVAERLGQWIAGATQATLSALLHLDRVAAWQARARLAIADLSGRTPPVLLDALTAWPMLSAPLAERLTGASRAAVQRNLDTLVARDLIREMTGQGRYRLWSAKM